MFNIDGFVFNLTLDCVSLCVSSKMKIMRWTAVSWRDSRQEKERFRQRV